MEKYEQLSKRTLVLWDKPSNKGFVFPGLFHILFFLGGGGVLVGGVVTKYNPFKFSSLYFLKSGDVNVMC